MSDYLWDKTGEPDAEAERLEELLGSLRFQPRTFEVPATLPSAPRRAVRTPSHFFWSRLAVAASLILTLLLGAWLIVSRQRTLNTPQLVNDQTAPEEKTTPRQQQANHEVAGATPENDAATTGDEKRRVVDHVIAPDVHRQQRRANFLAARKRFDERPRHSTVRHLNAPRGEIAKMTPQEKEAMEKFMLAMKVTSEKLGYAERQVAGLSRDTPQR
ncbi:MAG: hypothetical protein LC785_11625 [Acidobacteria bacterium]|nr:hypothetical protein [Acidobacteriota bacterium]MCA1642575.1 hypothetical protein [Acidobacteriota bacterium]